MRSFYGSMLGLAFIMLRLVGLNFDDEITLIQLVKLIKFCLDLQVWGPSLRKVALLLRIVLFYW